MLVEGSILGWVALVASFGFAFVAVAVAGESMFPNEEETVLVPAPALA